MVAGTQERHNKGTPFYSGVPINQPLLDAGQELIDLAQRSRYVLNVLQRPVPLGFSSLSRDYAGSMLTFAPLDPEIVDNANAFAEKRGGSSKEHPRYRR